MTLVDWLIVAFTVCFAVYGYAQGFLVGALSLVGFAAGAFLGTRLAPALLEDGSSSPYAPLFGLLGALIAGAILATGLEGIGIAVRRRVRLPGFAVVDGLLGAALTACVALGIVWVLGAVVLHTPGALDLRREAQRSAVLRRLNETLPPSGSILNALARLDPFPRIDAPGADVRPPPPGIGRDPDVRAAAPSIVRVIGTACGLGVSGSGWVGRDDLVVTNAHVVAGQSDTEVEVEGKEPRLPAQAVYFDATNDIAVLRVDGLDRRPLRLAGSSTAGEPGAVLGFPGNDPYTVAPGRLGQTRTVSSEDAYGRGPVERTIVSLRGSVRPGNSGGPMVGADGEVLTTVFAATVGGREAGGFGVPNSVVREALSLARGPVGTGPCTR